MKYKVLGSNKKLFTKWKMINWKTLVGYILITENAAGFYLNDDLIYAHI